VTDTSRIRRLQHENGCPRSRVWDLGKHACIRAAILLLAASCTAQTASYRVAGTVVNAVTGEPVNGAAVALLTVENGATFAATESGADGRFDLENLPAAKFQLTASRRGYTAGFYLQHGNFNSAIVTGQGQSTGDLIFQLAPEAVLSGVVTADGGDPVEGATVLLFKKSDKPAAKMEQTASVTTDDTGAYEFSNLEAGEYLLAVHARPWYAMSRFDTDLLRQPETEQQAALDVTYPVTFFDSTIDSASATPIVVTTGSSQQANVNLHAVPALHFAVQTPRKADDSVVYAELRQTIFGLDVGGDSGFITRNRDGVTEFGGVAPGDYELIQGDPPRILEMHATASQQIDPGAGAPALAVNGTLQPVQGTTLAGAYEITLDPVANSTVDPGGDAGDDAAGGSNPAPQPAFANPRSFSFRAVAAGAWRMHISNGLDVVSINADGRAHAGNLITLQDHALSIVATVSAGRTVRVEGFAHKADKGFAGAMVLLVPKDSAAMTELARRDQSDSDGSFGLLDVEPGDYTVVAIEDGWDLDWGNPAVIARYLPGGQSVTVKDSPDSQPGRRITLAGPVEVQPR
jgi:5-hydroxyisourate hydrolase-like protein (transthyretin family)